MAVELELSSKQKSRWREVLSHYQYQKEIDLLWYVVPKKGMGQSILKVAQQNSYQSPPILCFSILDELLDDPRRVTLTGISGNISMEWLWLQKCPLKVAPTRVQT